mmetsp:Transcript_17581/g.35015  ORF Transcript_17581/g.35015 Transcript_17581/m.35015 type:complete len:95 (-) Transcript_17581:128-412(-)
MRGGFCAADFCLGDTRKNVKLYKFGDFTSLRNRCRGSGRRTKNIRGEKNDFGTIVYGWDSAAAKWRKLTFFAEMLANSTSASFLSFSRFSSADA